MAKHGYEASVPTAKMGACLGTKLSLVVQSQTRDFFQGRMLESKSDLLVCAGMQEPSCTHIEGVDREGVGILRWSLWCFE